MVKYVKELKKEHSRLSHEQVLVVALATSVKNENSVFLMNRISDFLDSNPNFFTTQKVQQQ
jgi:hypothetical protein